jgi:hypothetical protein
LVRDEVASLLPQATLTTATGDLAPLSDRPSRPSVLAPGGTAAHGTLSTVLDRIFAGLNAGMLSDDLQDR